MVRTQVAEAKGPAPAGITRCDCGVAAVRLVTKECGPTQCRYFWKCAGRVCQFFDWDQDEVGKVEGEKRKEMMDQARYIEELQEPGPVPARMQAQRAQFEMALGQLQQHAAGNVAMGNPTLGTEARPRWLGATQRGGFGQPSSSKKVAALQLESEPRPGQSGVRRLLVERSSSQWAEQQWVAFCRQHRS